MEGDFIPTRGSIGKKNLDKKIEVVTYKSYKSKSRKESAEGQQSDKQNDKTENNFNIKQAKYEVIKFGMSGFTAKRKEEAKIQLAIKLGAKPPKNKYKNYKELMEERKKTKLREANRSSFQQLGKNNIGKSNAKGKSFDRKRRKEKGDILDIYGKVTKTV